MDLMGGRCVRLQQGDFNQRTDYSDDPVAVAKQFEAAGFQRLHMVDLDGAKAGTPHHLPVLERVCSQTKLVVDFSGGLKTVDNVESAFDAGAGLVAIGSLAVRDKTLFFSILQEFGGEKILLGVDVREGKLAIGGWLEQTNLDVFEFLAEMVSAGVEQVFCTDIGCDGLLSGPSLHLYQQLLSQFPMLHLIASGGVRSPADLADLARIGCSGAIVGKAIYENFEHLKQWHPKIN